MSLAARERPEDAAGNRGGVMAYLVDRLGLEELKKLAAKKHVPIHRSTLFYFLGGMALFLFAIQVITGILLSLYYKPSPDQAFESVRAIMTEVPYGWLIRSIHSWSANLLIGVLFLHLLTTFIMRAYRCPREFTWLSGIVLLGLFLAFGFSGYLLPWNELSFFATRVGTDITGKIPLVGHEMLLLARSGEEVTGDTLARFYSLHVVILPLVAMGILGVHLYLVQKHGMSIPDGEARRCGGADKVPSIPFIPHFLVRDMVGWYVALGLLAALAAIFPWELGQKANPFESAPPVKPEWYFLFMFATLEELPDHILGIEGPTVGVLFFGLCGLIILAVPWLDWGASRGRSRGLLNFLATWAVFAFIFQTAVGLGVLFETMVVDRPSAVLGLVVMLSGVAAVMFWLVVRALTRLDRGGGNPPQRSVLLLLLLAVVWAAAAAATAADAPSSEPAADKAAEAKPKDAAPTEAKAAAAERVADSDNSCMLCHAELTEADQKRFLVTAGDLASDIHWQKGLRCQDCHGGDPTVQEIKAHQAKEDFRAVKSPTDLVELCGTCHANVEYMKDYNPTLRTDQLREYWTSGHGRRVKEAGDAAVATCVSCHDKPHGSGNDRAPHGVRRVASLDSPVYVKNVARTCAKCHSDAKLMANYRYQDRSIGSNQYAEWRESVHGKALLEKNDLSAATCNRCHGNHGAVPPGVGSVANACGACHGKVASLFATARMKHAFEEVGLPGCVTCHSSHGIQQPSDEMLGLTSGAVCAQCHAGQPKGKFAPALARVNMERIIVGGRTAETLRKALGDLRDQIARAGDTLAEAERLGMPVPGPESNPKVDPRIYFRQATDALATARVEVHSFDAVPVEKAVAQGEKVASEVQESSERALRDHHFRRVWLAASLIPILVVIVVLVLYIRTLPAPGKA